MEELKTISVAEDYLLQRLRVLQQTAEVNEFLYIQNVIKQSRDTQSPVKKEEDVNEN